MYSTAGEKACSNSFCALREEEAGPCHTPPCACFAAFFGTGSVAWAVLRAIGCVFFIQIASSPVKQVFESQLLRGTVSQSQLYFQLLHGGMWIQQVSKEKL